MAATLADYGLVPFFTRQLEDPQSEQDRLGRVTAVQRGRSTVHCADSPRSAELAPGLRDADALARPTVGDWVLLDPSLARIERVLERKSLFKRVGAGERGALQPIAANIDTLFIATSCNEEFKESRLERYLALCDEAGATPVIVLTKTDLTEQLPEYLRRARGVQAGVAVEAVNALDAATLDGVRAWIGETATVAIVGSSGVGKSTLLNALAGEELAATGGIREQDKKGRHTTSHRELHRLPAGGLLIDVPGMRELRVAEVEDALGRVFEDVERLAARCRFGDCGHDSEPGCAVAEAIEVGALDPRRLDSYRKLLRENAQATATLAEKRAQGKEFGKMVRAAKRMKEQGNPD